jgi:trk system potassium uptake protein
VSHSVLVIGGGELAATLARHLVHDGRQVTVVDLPGAEGPVPAGEVEGVRLVVGDGTDLGVLEAAGIRTAAVVAAMGEDDPVNLLVSALARFEYGVDRTIARIVDPLHAWLFDADAGVDVAVDQAELLTRLVADEISGVEPRARP